MILHYSKHVDNKSGVHRSFLVDAPNVTCALRLAEREYVHELLHITNCPEDFYMGFWRLQSLLEDNKGVIVMSISWVVFNQVHSMILGFLWT
jgi:hypothetical protein